MEDFLAMVPPRPADMVGNSEVVAPKSFLCPSNFVVLRKICFKHMITIKICFAPQTLKPGCEPGSATIVSAF